MIKIGYDCIKIIASFCDSKYHYLLSLKGNKKRKKPFRNELAILSQLCKTTNEAMQTFIQSLNNQSHCLQATYIPTYYYCTNIKKYIAQQNPKTMKYLKKLILPFNFKTIPKKMVLSTSLTHLCMGYDFNKSLTNISHLINLTHLYLGEWFDQSLEPLSKLINLEHLVFGGDFFNQPITPILKLTKLISLELGFGFNQTIDKIPVALKYLYFNMNCVIGYDFKFMDISYMCIYNDYTYDYISSKFMKI